MSKKTINIKKLSKKICTVAKRECNVSKETWQERLTNSIELDVVLTPKVSTV